MNKKQKKILEYMERKLKKEYENTENLIYVFHMIIATILFFTFHFALNRETENFFISVLLLLLASILYALIEANNKRLKHILEVEEDE